MSFTKIAPGEIFTVKQASYIARSLFDQLADSLEKGNRVLFWKSQGEGLQFEMRSDFHFQIFQRR